MRPAQTLTLIAASLLLAPATSKSDTIAFEPSQIYSLGHVPESIAFGDLNSDGKIDVVIGNTFSDTSNNGTISVLLGEGDGTFTRLADTAVDDDRPEGVAVAKINGDSRLDVITSNFSGNSVSVLRGRGDGTFRDPVVTNVTGGPRYVVAADFDGDGSTDVATSNYDGDSVSILKGDDTGHFTVVTTIPVGNGPEMLALAHLNNDEHLDLVTSNALGDSVTPLFGDGAGGFTAGTSHTVQNDPRYLLARDLDGDGLDDLIVANNRSHTVSLERNDGAGGFTTERSLSFSQDQVITLERPVYLAFEDMNGDGRKDILVSWAANNLFTIFPGTPDSFGFDPPSAVQTGEEPVGIGAADFDGDGDFDVFVADAEADTGHVYISYLSDPGVILDNGAAGTTAIGPWPPSDTPFAFGPTSLFSKDGTTYVWESNLEGPGDYEVLVWWTVTANRSKAVPVEVSHADGTTSLLLDQTIDIGVWHSLGAFSFGAGGKVTLTAPQDDLAASADAVRFHKLTAAPPGPPRGRIPVSVRPRPDDFDLGNRSMLGFQATLTTDNPNESEDFTAAVFSPIGSAEESSLIAECRLYIDSNGNGAFDSGDRQLGTGRSFGSDVRSIVFDGFRETLADKSAVDVFVVADLMPAAVSVNSSRSSTGSSAVACGAALALSLVCWRRRRALSGCAFAVALLLPLVFLSINGCGGSGGGGGNHGGGGPSSQTHSLRIELSALVLEGSTTGTPSTSEGLPASGWEF
jgi:hypothetical protein